MGGHEKKVFAQYTGRLIRVYSGKAAFCVKGPAVRGRIDYSRK